MKKINLETLMYEINKVINESEKDIIDLLNKGNYFCIMFRNKKKFPEKYISVKVEINDEKMLASSK